MITDEIKKRLTTELRGELFFDEPMSSHSSMKVGGRAAIFAIPEDVDDLALVLVMSKELNLPTFTVGAGSNVLVRDAGYNGIVISTAKLNKYSLDESDDGTFMLSTDSGVLVNDLINFSLGQAMSGFEKLAGIPGTVGGAIFMNAGTNIGSVSDFILEVTVVDRSGRLHTWPKEKIEFSYRKTKLPRNGIITNGKFVLSKGEKETLEKNIFTMRDNRKKTQPLKWPSLGSIFKNPDDKTSAGELIEDAKLKGVRVGGARISDKHANWIINEGNATAKDVEVLIQLVKEKVKEGSGVLLDREVIIVGDK